VNQKLKKAIGISPELNNTMRSTVFTLLVLFNYDSFSQTIIRSEKYFDDIQDGVYINKSLSDEFSSQNIILAERKIEPIISSINYLALKGKIILLFKNDDPQSNRDVAGMLIENTFVEILETHFRSIYKDPNVEWGVTFDVWHKISVNDEIYFTDYLAHDLVFKKELTNLSQTFLLFAQDTGYDYYYANGYPEHFYVVILNKSNEIIFESSELDFIYGEEFWEGNLGSIDWEVLPNGHFKFTLSGVDLNDYNKKINFTRTWNGTNLIR